jgi:hypothetical protein
MQCGGKLQRSFEGPAHEVFARVLRGLSGKKLTKPGAFRSADGSGCAVKCSYKVRGLALWCVLSLRVCVFGACFVARGG